ncbi:MAG: hypothetical protein KIH10_16140, partial [Candidatus Freyarchaeota archaeon]|nr:hypothetical protein [Candidatus Jordarchaeia archaeon]
KIHKNRGLNALSPSKPPQKVNTKEYKNQNVIKGRLVVSNCLFNFMFFTILQLKFEKFSKYYISILEKVKLCNKAE